MEEKVLQEKVAELLHSGDRESIAELIVEYVQPNHITSQFMDLIISSRALNPGDALVKKLRKGLEVHTLVPGSVHMAHEITVSERVNYVLDGADVKVTYNEWELESGHLGTVEEIRREMLAKLRDYYLTKVFTALSTVWNASNTPNNYVSLGTALTSTALKNAIDRINQTTGGVRAVIGSRYALTPVTTFGAGWSDGVNNWAVEDNIREIMQTGWLGRYYGAPLIAVDQVWDNLEDYNALIPQDKVIVVGENVGEFITFGEVKSKQWSDMNPTPPQWMLEIYQQFGLMIWNAQGIYVIDNIT